MLKEDGEIFDAKDVLAQAPDVTCHVCGKAFVEGKVVALDNYVRHLDCKPGAKTQAKSKPLTHARIIDPEGQELLEGFKAQQKPREPKDKPKQQ